ncbi:MAG: DUF1294 domain-containing protein [Bacteroides sp.]|nr:DUF1294 domain-containing protein [Bacteroides sp.]
MYFISANLVALFLFGYDKHCAKKRLWRVPEITLLTSAVIGGAAGAWAAMSLFHHKTRKTRFWIVVISSLAIQVTALSIMLINIT